MIELRMGKGYYLILMPDYEDYSVTAYLHRFGQVIRTTVRQNIKDADEIYNIIANFKEEVKQ